MKYFFLSFIIICFMALGCSKKEPRSTIAVHGEGAVKMPVEFVTFNVGFEDKSADVKSLMKNSHQKMLRIKKILLDTWGIPDTLLHTDDSSIRRIYNRESSQTLYRFSQTITVTLDSLDLYETLRQDLSNAGANRFAILSFGNFNPTKYAKKALKKAYDNALEKAKLLAASAEVGLGEPLKIDTGNYFSNNRGLNKQVTSDIMLLASPPPPLPNIIESALIKKFKLIKADVHVQFTIK